MWEAKAGVPRLSGIQLQLENRTEKSGMKHGPAMTPGWMLPNSWTSRGRWVTKSWEWNRDHGLRAMMSPELEKWELWLSSLVTDCPQLGSGCMRVQRGLLSLGLCRQGSSPHSPWWFLMKEAVLVCPYRLTTVRHRKWMNTDSSGWTRD